MKPDLDERLLSQIRAPIVDGAKGEKATRAMPLSEVPVSSLLDTVPALMWAAMPDGSPSYLNQRCSEYTGRSLRDFLRFGWADLIHPEEREETVRAWLHAMENGSSYETKHRIRRADGEYRWFLSRGEPMCDQEGRVIHHFGLSVDVDESVKREAEIRRLVDANIVGVMIWELEGRILEANDAFLRTVGYERAELVSGRLRWTDLTPVEWRERDERALAELYSTGTFQPFEKEYFRKHGSRVPVLIGGAAFDEGCKRGVAFVVDLTERKSAEEELRRSRAYLSEAQRVSHTGSWAWNNVTRQVVYWSEECFRIHGRDPAQRPPSLEQILADIHPDEVPQIMASLELALREAREWEGVYRLINFADGPRTVRSMAHPVSDNSGRVVEYIGTVVDVTDQKRAEEERKEHLWFLESMDRINRAMQRMNDLEGMLSGVLEETLAIFGSDRAWLVYPCDPAAVTSRVVMEHTRPEFPGAFALGEDFPVDTQAAELLGRVLEGPGAVTNLRIPPEVSDRFSIQSVIAIAVRPREGRPYLFGLHQCSRARNWNAAECRLFEEIARRLEDALTSVLAHRNLLASREELRASEERFRTFVDHATDAFFLYDEECIVLDVNRQACEALGYTREELIGMHPTQFNADMSQERTLRIKQRSREHGSVTFTAQRRRKDGSLFPVEERVQAFKRGGHVLGIGLARDITDRRHREQRLLAQYQVTQTLSKGKSLDEAAPHILGAMCEALEWDLGALWQVDPEAGVLKCIATWPSVSAAPANFAAATRAISFGPGMGLPGRVWSSGGPVCIRDIVLEPELPRAKSAAKAGLHAAFAFPVMLKSGVVGVIELFSREVRDADRGLLQMMAAIGSQVAQFIERTRAEDALRHAREKLAQASRIATVAELSASIAHEINQPLQAIVANGHASLRWLDATPPNIEKAIQTAKRVVRDGNAAAEVVGRIRALFKHASPAKVDLDINKLILQVRSLMADEIQGNGVSLETELGEDVPTITADAVQIEQVIVNLVRNAIEAMAPTMERPKPLWIRSRREGDYVVVDVQDHGVGLADSEKIFEPFITTKETGLGMGLAICRSIVEAHAGRIWVAQNPERGVTFSFSLPIENSVTG